MLTRTPKNCIINWIDRPQSLPMAKNLLLDARAEDLNKCSWTEEHKSKRLNEKTGGQTMEIQLL